MGEAYPPTAADYAWAAAQDAQRQNLSQTQRIAALESAVENHAEHIAELYRLIDELRPKYA